MLNVILFTIFQAVLSTLAAALIGLASAYFAAKKDFAGRRFLLSFSAVPLCLPSLIVALGYVSFFGMNGRLNQFLMTLLNSERPPLTFLYSAAGIIIAQGFYNYPLVMKIVSEAWEHLTQDQEEAARLLGAGEFKIFYSITLVRLVPALISACLPIFLFCFFSFTMILIFAGVGYSTLEVELFKIVRGTLNFKDGFLIAGTETFIALFIIFLYSKLEKKTSALKGISFDTDKLKRTRIQGKKEHFLFGALILIITIFFIAPLAGIAINAFTSRASKSLSFNTILFLFKSQRFVNSIGWTFLTAGCTAVLCSITGFLYGSFLRLYDKNQKRTILQVIPLGPMAISSIMTGFFIKLIIQQGNWFTLTIAQTILMWPVAFRQIYAALQKIPQPVIDVSLLLSRGKFDTLTRVMLPSIKHAVVSGALCCFAMSAGDSTLPLVLSIPEFDTLALYTYRLAGRYRFNEACAAGLILAVLCAVVFSLSRKKGDKNVF